MHPTPSKGGRQLQFSWESDKHQLSISITATRRERKRNLKWWNPSSAATCALIVLFSSLAYMMVPGMTSTTTMVGSPGPASLCLGQPISTIGLLLSTPRGSGDPGTTSSVQLVSTGPATAVAFTTVSLNRPCLLCAEPPQPRVALPAPPAQAAQARPRRGRPPLAGASRATRGTPRAGRGSSRPVVIPLRPSVRATTEEPTPAPLEIPDERPYTPSGAPYTPSGNLGTPPGDCTSPEPDEPQDGAEASAVARELEVVRKSDGTQGLKITFRAVPNNPREPKD
jgi:hypothetical protein